MTAEETSGRAGLLCVCTHHPESQRYGSSAAGGGDLYGPAVVSSCCTRSQADR